MSPRPSTGARLPELSAAKRALLEAMRERQDRPPAPIRRLHAREAPLSFAQERLYFLDRMERGSTAYNVHLRLRLPGAVDEPALERALGEIVRRHDALRTTFHEADGVPVQVVAPFAGFALPVEELSGLVATEVRRRAAEDAGRPFDLATGPLFRATLLRRGPVERELWLAIHHIVVDGWSLGVIRRELAALYAAYSAGRDSPLPEPALQCADFAAWQRERVRDGALERELAWWRERLAGAPELLALPTDPPPAAARTRGTHRVAAVLPPPVAERLEALARAGGATPFMALLAAFQALLSRYGGGHDVVVGTPVAGRTRPETEAIVGFFVNTLVLRTDLSGAPTFREAVRRTRAATLGAFEHPEVPFERLVAELRPDRSPDRSPLVQVMFALDDGAGGAPHPGLAVEDITTDGAGIPDADVEARAAKFDLTFTCVRRAEGIAVVLRASADRFDGATAERMLAHWVRLIELASNEPDRRLSQIELLTEAERGEVLEGWNATDRPYPLDVCIHRRIEARAARTPGAVALAHEGGRITYAALDASSNRLAGLLRARGIGRGSFVPILAERGPYVAVAMLAVMKSGAAFVPLDSAWPPERLRRVMDDLRPALLLADERVLDLARSLAASVLPVPIDASGPIETTNSIDSMDSAGSTDIIDQDPGNEPGADDPVYAIYTSGSTGAPRAAVATHGGIANRFGWMSERFGAASARSVLQTTRHVYDSAVWQLFWPLTEGGRAVIPRDGGETDATYLAGLTAAEGVTMADFVPSVFAALVPELAADAAARGRLASLRTVVVGGEQITAAAAHRFMERFPGVEVINLYGPTECSIGSVHHAVRPADGSRVPIGRPIANTTALILDRGGRLAPVGVPGEIHLGGRCVGLGYLGDPRKTAAAFVPHPYARRPGERLYRTGDLGRWRPDGSIECLGRLDEQVKIRGVRVEPGEIEAALLEHPGVRAAVVVARERSPGDVRLVAYVAAGEPGSVSPSALREHLRARLPEALVPGAFVVLPALPLAPGGKVDRRALPPPEWGADAVYVPPRSPAEEILAGIWTGVLEVDRVGAHDDFFHLGGHSLLALRVIARVRQAFGVEVPLRTLFEHPTVAGLAARIARAPEDGDRSPPLCRVPEDGDPAASFGQERLWRAYRRDPADTSWNLHYGFRIRGAADVRALARALAEVVRRHEPLRTTFREDGDGVKQVIHPPASVPPLEIDLGGRPASEREAALRALAAEEAVRAFDLERGPLLRAVLARLGEGECALLLTLHHVATDGWSTGVLMREISALYQAYAAGREPALPEPEIRYAGYAAWQRARLAGGAMKREMAYWSARLAGAPRLDLPTDRPRFADARGRAETRSIALGVDLSRAVRSLARREGCTPHMTLLAAFQALLARESGMDDVSVGTPVAGRARREAESLIGFFTNTVVIRADLSGRPGFRALLGRAREATLGAYAHADLPFATLASALRPECGPEEMPLFQAVFELEQARAAEDALLFPGAEVTALPRPPAERTLRSELRLSLRDDGARIDGVLWYRAELFDAATIDRMIRRYLALLEGVVAEPDRPVADLPV